MKGAIGDRSLRRRAARLRCYIPNAFRPASRSILGPKCIWDVTKCIWVLGEPRMHFGAGRGHHLGMGRRRESREQTATSSSIVSTSQGVRDETLTVFSGLLCSCFPIAPDRNVKGANPNSDVIDNCDGA